MQHKPSPRAKQHMQPRNSTCPVQRMNVLLARRVGYEVACRSRYPIHHLKRDSTSVKDALVYMLALHRGSGRTPVQSYVLARHLSMVERGRHST